MFISTYSPKLHFLASYNLFHCDLTSLSFDHYLSLKLSVLRPQYHYLENWISWILIFFRDSTKILNGVIRRIDFDLWPLVTLTLTKGHSKSNQFDPYHCVIFRKDLMSSFWVFLLTNRQTGENNHLSGGKVNQTWKNI